MAVFANYVYELEDTTSTAEAASLAAAGHGRIDVFDCCFGVEATSFQ
jgi:hypothetical protein